MSYTVERTRSLKKIKVTYWIRNSRFLTVSEAGETNIGNQGVSKSKYPENTQDVCSGP